MKLVIIGARGMLGSMLAGVFADYEPLVWDRAEIDITDEADVTQKLMELRPDVIINAAAYTDVDGAEDNRAPAFAVNADGVRHLSRAAKSLGATLVHYSTDYVFPGTRAKGYQEDDEPGPAVNVYGESKLAGEVALAEANPHFYLLRTAWLYGPGGKNFVDTMLTLAETKKELNIVHDQVGSPTFTKDVALATRELIEWHSPFGIYHTVNAGQTSWYDFAAEIFRQAGSDIKLIPITSRELNRRAARPAFSVLQHTRGPVLRPWQEALADYLHSR